MFEADSTNALEQQANRNLDTEHLPSNEITIVTIILHTIWVLIFIIRMATHSL